MDPYEGFAQEGFLSRSAEWIAKYRASSAAWFNLAERLNRTGMQMIERTAVTADHRRTADPKFLAFLLFIRTMSNFQGVLLLTERGLVVEARTLARSCYENLFCIGALKADDSKFVTELLHDELASRKGRAKFILERPDKFADAGEDAMQKLAERLAEWEASGEMKVLNYRRAAETAGILDLYVLYRQLSADAAHPTVSSLDRYIVANEKEDDIRYIEIDPSYDAHQVGDTLSLACSAVIGACGAFAEMYAISENSSVLGEYLRELERIHAETEDD